MKENLELNAKQKQKAFQELKQSIPSSFSVNQEYFNERLVRIKQKIDELIKQHVSLQPQGVKQSQKIKNTREQHSGSVKTSRTVTESFGRQRPLPSTLKITEQTKQNIQKIYNEIHLLQLTTTKDENCIETNTFELRSFLKDLRNQQKRLARMLPDSLIFQLEEQKKTPFKKSQIIIKGEIETLIEGFQSTQEKPNPDAQKQKQKQLQMAKELIDQAFKKRKIFNQNKLYYADIQDQQCNMCQCQLI